GGSPAEDTVFGEDLTDRLAEAQTRRRGDLCSPAGIAGHGHTRHRACSRRRIRLVGPRIALLRLRVALVRRRESLRRRTIAGRRRAVGLRSRGIVRRSTGGGLPGWLVGGWGRGACPRSRARWCRLRRVSAQPPGR